ncbi:MAG: hypothetical protein ACRDJE_20000 [Dehalococcoidia bacterium]
MSMNAVLVYDRFTGTVRRMCDDEPVKLRVCRTCGRVHEHLTACLKAA